MSSAKWRALFEHRLVKSTIIWLTELPIFDSKMIGIMLLASINRTYYGSELALGDNINIFSIIPHIHMIYVHIIFCYIFTIYLTWKIFKDRKSLLIGNTNDSILWWRHQMETVFGPFWGDPSVTCGSPHKFQWRGASRFSLIYAWTNGWANNRNSGTCGCHRAHYNVIVIAHGCNRE